MNLACELVLNHAVAVANVHGPRASIEAVEAIRNRGQLNSYYLLYAVLGEFEALLSNPKAAEDYFEKSMELATIESEGKFLLKRLRALGAAKKGRALIMNFRISMLCHVIRLSH